MTSKQLSPLRRKDQATGYQAAVRDIVTWLEQRAPGMWRPDILAHGVKVKFGGNNADR